MSSTVIVIPCYNEEQRLNTFAFLTFVRLQPECRLLFVNDGSTDGTLERLREICDFAAGRMKLLNLAQNGGKAEAVRQGMLCALAQGAEYVGFWDADLATPLSAVPEFARVLDRLPQTDVVLGSRVSLLGRVIRRNAKRRRLGRLFATAASWVLSIPIQDTQCGAKLFRASEELQLALQPRFLARWIFDVELLARLKQLRGDGLEKSLYEYPLEQWQEVAGSKLKATDFLKAPKELWNIYWTYLGPLATPVRSLPAGPVAGTTDLAPEGDIRDRQAA